MGCWRRAAQRRVICNVALPSLIAIDPAETPRGAAVVVPGSKSITNRALILAALASGRTTLQGALWSEDTQVMTEALRGLGFEVEVELDSAEPANRSIHVRGAGGRIPVSGGADAGSALELRVGNAGTAARFLAALVCLGRGTYRLSGVARMHERPQAELFTALRLLGYRVDATGDRLPAVIHGAGARPGRVRVTAASSSQFASALLLGAEAGGWEVEVDGGDTEELPYVEMTRRMAGVFPRDGGVFRVEPDASSGSYFWAADHLFAGGVARGSCVAVRGWPVTGWQIDEAFPRFLPLPRLLSRNTDLGDSILTAMVLAPFGSEPVRFVDLGRLRVQECERVAAMRTELGKCGVRVEEEGDSLTIHPAAHPRGAEIETYGDHRIAMCFAVFGLRVPGVRLRDPGCVRKTFPNYFAKLAAPVPGGLGVRILDSRTGRGLAGADLLAD